MHKKTNGIILKRKKIGEADKLLVIYTSDLGKISALACGIEKISSRRAGHLEPLMLSLLELTKGKKNNYLIKEAKVSNNFKSTRSDLYKTSLACYASELVDKTTFFEEKNHLIFNLLKKTLSLLEKSDKSELIKIIRSFEIHLVNLLGFRPELNQCLSCKNKITAKQVYFCFVEGGIYCSKCYSIKLKAIKTSSESINILKFLQNNSLQKSLILGPEDIKKIGNLMHFYIKSILEIDLQSKIVIKKLGLAESEL
jgi:DNA repair protein RecO (recombination protein O)